LDRLANYTFIFLLIFLFILEGRSDDHLRIIIALFISFLISATAFFIHWVDLDGFFAATVFGAVVLGLGGWVLAVLVLVFFITGSLISRDLIVISDEKRDEAFSTRFKVRRNGLQIWSNGFWLVVCGVLWFIFQVEVFLIMAVAAVASATADTWATELGSRKQGKTVLITNFNAVEPGTDGGVSLRGILAGFWGALLIALGFMILQFGTSIEYVSIITISGFFGCIADSYLGAFYQYRLRDEDHWFNRSFTTHEYANNAVNWGSTGIGAFVALILMQLT